MLSLGNVISRQKLIRIPSYTAGYFHVIFCLLITVAKLNISCCCCTKKNLSCKPFSWILKKTLIWNFPLLLFMCLSGCLIEMNSLKHRASGYGLSIACVSVGNFWSSRLHRAQVYGLSPAWFFMCHCLLFQEMNHFPHKAHWYEFFTEWSFMCFFV